MGFIYLAIIRCVFHINAAKKKIAIHQFWFCEKNNRCRSVAKSTRISPLCRSKVPCSKWLKCATSHWATQDIDLQSSSLVIFIVPSELNLNLSRTTPAPDWVFVLKNFSLNMFGKGVVYKWRDLFLLSPPRFKAPSRDW